MKPTEFNKLRPREKWDNWEYQSGKWMCPSCKGIFEDGPNRADPFPRSAVYCGNCDFVLTQRTGGGMSDPFNWVLKEEES